MGAVSKLGYLGIGISDAKAWGREASTGFQFQPRRTSQPSLSGGHSPGGLLPLRREHE